MTFVLHKAFQTEIQYRNRNKPQNDIELIYVDIEDL